MIRGSVVALHKPDPGAQELRVDVGVVDLVGENDGQIADAHGFSLMFSSPGAGHPVVASARVGLHIAAYTDEAASPCSEHTFDVDFSADACESRPTAPTLVLIPLLHEVTAKVDDAVVAGIIERLRQPLKETRWGIVLHGEPRNGI